jgi:hypothetical protein
MSVRAISFLGATPLGVCERSMRDQLVAVELVCDVNRLGSIIEEPFHVAISRSDCSRPGPRSRKGEMPVILNGPTCRPCASGTGRPFAFCFPRANEFGFQ